MRATGRICSQALKSKAVRGWPQCCVWQITSPSWSPILYEKACNFNMYMYSTGTRDHHFTWLSEPRYAIHPLWCLHVMVTKKPPLKCKGNPDSSCQTGKFHSVKSRRVNSPLKIPKLFQFQTWSFQLFPMDVGCCYNGCKLIRNAWRNGLETSSGAHVFRKVRRFR